MSCNLALQHIRSDLQVCAHGTARGNVAIVAKQFSRLGLRTWWDMVEAKKPLGMYDDWAYDRAYVKTCHIKDQC